MITLWLVRLGLLAGVQHAAEYTYEIQYDKPADQYPGLEHPSPGSTIDLMDVSQVAKPNQIRISFTEDPTEIAITWTTNGVSPTEQVKYGMVSSDLGYVALSTSHQFDWNYQDDTSDYYYTSGFIHEALMVNLEPGKKYFYQIESNGETSDVLSFIAPPEPGQDTPISLLHIGDQGIYGTSVMVVKDMMDRMENKDFHGLLHCGDIAYADKHDGSRPPPSGMAEQSKWDTWGQMVEPLAAKIPYMVTPGNHEVVGYESGWENGTIYQKRFIMPGNERFYSYALGMVYMISVSTDDDIDSGTIQGDWFEQTLADIDRDTYPWVVVFQHRPIYNSNTNHGNWTGESTYVYDAAPDVVLPEFTGWENGHYENLLVKYNVNFVLTGHVHNYERTYPVKRVPREEVVDKRRKRRDTNEYPGLVAVATPSYENVRDPIHIICGHAGAGLYTSTWSDYEDEEGNRPEVYKDDWAFSASKSLESWGHCEMEFLDRRTAKHYMYKMGESDPTEEITITRAGAGRSAVSWILVVSTLALAVSTA